jgi:DNA gyrase subunit A
MLKNWSRSEEITLDDLMKFVKGPDFPTGGIILHKTKDSSEGLIAAYSSGRGKITLQARAHIEEMGRGRSRIIVTELPYQTNKSTLIERIADLARSGTLDGISDLRDESDRQGMRIVIELSKSADPEKVLLKLYQKTPMQGTFSVIMLALVDGEPRLLNLKQALSVYLDHRIEIVRRRSEYELDLAKKRLHILEGLRVALKNLDEIIRLIRAAKDVNQARERLIRKFKISEAQANAILEIPLRRLAGLERKKIELEYKETRTQIKGLEQLLGSGKKIRTSITKELLELKTTYGDARRTQIVQHAKRKGKGASPLTAKDLAITKDSWIVITKKGLISRTPSARLPRISGRSAPTFVIGAGGRDHLFLFNSRGLAVSIPLHVIPESGNQNNGVPIRSVSPFDTHEGIVAGIALSKDLLNKNEGFLLFGTINGVVKKTSLSLFPGPSSKAFTAIKVSKDDSLGWVEFTHGDDEIMLVSQSGMAIRFSETTVRPIGMAAAGVQGMKLEDKKDKIVLMTLIQPKGEMFLISEDGVAKRTKLSEYPKQGRYGKGVLTWKSGDEVRIIGGGVGSSDQRISVRFGKSPPRSIRIGDAVRRSRAGAGNTLLETEKGNRIVQVVRITSRTVASVPPRKKAKPGKKGRKKPTAKAQRVKAVKPSGRKVAGKSKTKRKSSSKSKTSSRSQTKKGKTTKK